MVAGLGRAGNVPSFRLMVGGRIISVFVRTVCRVCETVSTIPPISSVRDVDLAARCEPARFLQVKWRSGPLAARLPLP